MVTTNTWRRRCMKLADEVGCTLESERVRVGAEITTTYWIHPPDDVYEGDNPREDPLNGLHAFKSWERVLEALEGYRIDMHFWRYEIGTSDTNGVLEAAGGAGRELLKAWIDDGKPALGLVLADWLRDNGRGDLADALHAGIMKATGR